jgi:hypothetical protein
MGRFLHMGKHHLVKHIQWKDKLLIKLIKNQGLSQEWLSKYLIRFLNVHKIFSLESKYLWSNFIWKSSEI